jgi:hypothetical protein
MLVAVITTEGTINQLEIDGSLESMQAIVGGLIQPVDVLEDATVWVNEESLMLGMPYNYVASRFVAQFGFEAYLCGNAFVTGGVDEDGNTMALRPDYLEALLSVNELTS